MHMYDGIQECCNAFHCHSELIKALIYTGHPFPYIDEQVTFDIAPGCPMHIEKKRDGAKNDLKRWFIYDIVPDNREGART